MNGIESNFGLERYSFCGRNSKIISKVLKKNRFIPSYLINFSIKASHYEVFCSLIKEFEVKEFSFFHHFLILKIGFSNT